MVETRLKAENLHFSYGNQKVIDGADFLINSGRITSILGKNGSGKSTILKLLAGILRPGEGKVILRDKPIQNIPLKNLYSQLSYVPQVHAIDIPLTVKEVIMTGRNPHRNLLQRESLSDRDRYSFTIEMTNLAAFENRIFNNLSGGEKQKVLIARAICQTDLMMLLDEPTSSLDIGNKHEIMDLLKRFSQTGSAVVMVSHDINEVNRYADDVIIVHNQKVFCDKKENLLNTEFLNSIYGMTLQSISNGGMKFFY